MDNQIYGLTKGQTSPRSAAGFITKSTPNGAIEPSLKPLEVAFSWCDICSTKFLDRY